MKRVLSTVGFSLLCGSACASSLSLDSLQNLSQSDFHKLSEDLGAALSYKPMEPAAALGPLGVDLGLGLTGTTLANTDAVQKAVSSSTVFSTLPVPTLRLTKGLPFNTDVGVIYGRVPSSSINLFGGQVKWAFLPGDLALPAVAVRAAMTRLNGVGQLGFETYSVDLSVSKGFVFITPYAGIGEVRSRSATDGLPLQQENINQSKVYAGVDLNLGLTNLVAEADSTGGIHSYSVKVGFRF